ncbi:MAG: hypothetical protein AAB295_01275, partial [Chloroflexota bacterium]
MRERSETGTEGATNAARMRFRAHHRACGSVALVVPLLLTGCVSHRYHVRLHAADPEESLLCELEGGESTSDGTVSETRNTRCQPLGGVPLYSPGQITVTALGAEPGTEYALSVEEHRAASGDATPAGVLDEFLRRVGRLAGPAANALAGAAGEAGGDAARAQVEQIASRVGAALGRTLRERAAVVLGPVPDQVLVTALAQFDDGDNVAEILAMPTAPFYEQLPGLFRMVEVDAADVAALAAEDVSPDELANAVVRQCEDTGWGALPPGGPDLLAFLGGGSTPSAEAVLGALGFEAATVREFLDGGTVTGFDDRIRVLLAEAEAEREAGREPTGHAATIERLFVESRFDVRLSTCAANLEFLARPSVLALDDTHRTRMGDVATSVAALRERTHGAARLYAMLIAPAVTEVAVD